MLIPVLDSTGNQIAWIDHLKLEEGSLFRMGERVVQLNAASELLEVPVGVIDPTDLADVADDGRSSLSML